LGRVEKAQLAIQRRWAHGNQASIQIPAGYVFLGASDTRRFLELNGNLPEDDSYTIGPKTLKWFGEFRFEDSGYVSDNEKLDPDSLLDTLKSHNREQQAEMKRAVSIPLSLSVGLSNRIMI